MTCGSFWVPSPWSSVQFSSVSQLCLTLCDPTDCSTPGFPVLTIFRNLLKLMSIESVMPSNHLILCHPLLLVPSTFPSIGVFFLRSQLFASGGQSIGALASASVLTMNIQGWFHLDCLVWSPYCPRDSQESFPAPQFKSISSLALSLLYGPTLTSIHNYWKNLRFDYLDFCRKWKTTNLKTCPSGGRWKRIQNRAGIQDPSQEVSLTHTL